jgi:hypothetical protein
MFPLDAMQAPTFAECLEIWKDPKWAEAGAPFPGEAKALEAWNLAAPLRDLVKEANDG